MYRSKIKRVADKHSDSSLEFKEDDLGLPNKVSQGLFKANNGQTTSKYWQGMHSGHEKCYAKLAQRYYGPFQILKRLNEIAYRLKLPAH